MPSQQDSSFFCENSPNVCTFKQRRQIIRLACELVCLELIKKPRRRLGCLRRPRTQKSVWVWKLGDGTEQAEQKMRFSFCQTLLITSTRTKAKRRRRWSLGLSFSFSPRLEVYHLAASLIIETWEWNLIKLNRKQARVLSERFSRSLLLRLHRCLNARASEKLHNARPIQINFNYFSPEHCISTWLKINIYWTSSSVISEGEREWGQIAFWCLCTPSIRLLRGKWNAANAR